MIIFDLDGTLADEAACVDDKPIEAVATLHEKIAFAALWTNYQIWSDRYESLRDKTLDWIIKHFYWDTANRSYISDNLKMRPIDDDSPKEELFEKWLIKYMYPPLQTPTPENEGTKIHRKEIPEMIFSPHQPTIDMFRKRGIFVFDCNQGE